MASSQYHAWQRSQRHRRVHSRYAAACAFTGWCGAALLTGSAATAAERSAVELTPRGRAVHAAGFVCDGHNDLPWRIHEEFAGDLARVDLNQPQAALHTDWPRLMAGGVGAVFWSAYVPAESAQDGTALQQTLRQMALIRDLVARYPERLELALRAEDVARIRQSGKIASMIGIEGGHAIEGSVATLRRLYEGGARYMTLTHSDTLAWADSATDAPRSDGLAPLGVEVVREMNRLGMLVDISHVSAATMHDVLDVAQAPLIASHSSAFAIAPHPRNVPDDVLRRVAKNGGVVMINFFSGYVVRQGAEVLAEIGKQRLRLSEDDDGRATLMALFKRAREEGRLPAGTIHDVVDHIEHVLRVAGPEHVGLGSDFDGVTQLPAQLTDVSSFPLLTQELLNRGYAEEVIHGILSGNVLRAWRDAEQAAERLRSQTP